MTAVESHADSWENRRLCSDEACIGVIGRDGRCTECGKPGGDPIPHPATDPIAAPEPGIAAPPSAPTPAAGASDDWDQRRLCSDEACIGVIGPDGRCRECGKPVAT